LADLLAKVKNHIKSQRSLAEDGFQRKAMIEFRDSGGLLVDVGDVNFTTDMNMAGMVLHGGGPSRDRVDPVNAKLERAMNRGDGRLVILLAPTVVSSLVRY
jgi:hypothetical protein